MRNHVFRVRKVMLAVSLLFAGIILVPSTVRTLITSSYVLQINLVSYCGLVFLLLRAFNGREAVIRRDIFTTIILAAIFFGVLDHLLQKYGSQIMIMCLSYFIFPFFLLLCDIRNEEMKKRIILLWYRYLSIAAHIVFFSMLIDAFTGHAASKTLYDIFQIPSMLQMINEGRSVTLYGHSLTSKTITMLYYLMSVTLNETGLKKTKTMWSMFVCSFCVLMAGSKGGVLLLLIAVLIINFRYRRIRYLLLSVVVVYVLFLAGLFDTVLERFLTSATLTTGRLSAIEAVLSNRNYRFYVFHGMTGISTTDYTLQGFGEISIFAWAYRHGILNAVLRTITLYMLPALIILRGKKPRLFIMFLLMIMEFNTSNYISSTGDGLFVYIIMLWVFLMINSIHEISDNELRNEVV